MSGSSPVATWTSSGSPSWKLPARRSTPTGSGRRWRLGPDRSSTGSPAGRSAASTSWSGTTPMRTDAPIRRGADQGRRAEEHLAGQEAGLADRRVSRGRDPSRGRGAAAGGRSLLEPVLRGGELIPGVLPSLNEIRDRAARNLAALRPSTAHREPGRVPGPQLRPPPQTCETAPWSSTGIGLGTECSGTRGLLNGPRGTCRDAKRVPDPIVHHAWLSETLRSICAYPTLRLATSDLSSLVTSGFPVPR